MVIITRVPKHIAIIPDGNRRWAQGSGLEKYQGYQYGLDPGVQALRIAKEYGVDELTYYGFTTDNCKRPKAQVEAFTEACVEAVKRIAAEDAELLVVGNTQSDMFPNELLQYTKERVCIGTGGIRVNFLVNYGWEWDLNQMQCTTQNRNTITGQLHSKDVSRIDMVVRWGGRKRLSGLLPIQAVYADFYTIEDMWPDFKPHQLIDAIKWYDHQDITLGG